MGGRYSSLGPQTPSNFSYFALIFRKTDKIKLVYANKQVINVVQNAVAKFWNPGIINQQGKDKDGTYEIRFHGTPFCRSVSSELSIQCKRMCCEILMNLYVLGWRLIVSSDLSQITDLATWFFHKDANEYKPQMIYCLSISSCDSIQLIGAPDYMRKVFKKAVIYSYETGVRSEQFYGKDYELKLKGYPWSTSGLEESIMARKVILELFRRFDKSQFQFYGTANLKGTADCIFFIHTDVPSDPTSQYMMMSLNQHDRICLLDCPKKIVNDIRVVIMKRWKKGMQTESNYHLAWEYKLSGSPWWSHGEEAVMARNLITHIFQSLLCSGISLVACLDISHRTIDKSIFILKTCTPLKSPHFCLSLNESDKIRVINGDKEMNEIIRDVIKQGWPSGLKKENDIYGGCHEFRLASHPWSTTSGNQNLVARKMMCLLLKQLNDKKWKIICSADVSAKYCLSGNNNLPEYPLDVHSWFLVQVDDEV